MLSLLVCLCTTRHQFEGTAKDEDADVPLPPTKPSASSMKPVEKASPLELSTEERDPFAQLRNDS